MQQKMARTTRKLWRQCVHVKNQRLNTVLHFAACSGSTSAVRCLVRLGANHALQNDGAQSALDVCESKTCRAALLRLPQAVDEVCDRGMKENQGGGGGLSTVALNGAIQSLLNHGEHVNATSSIQGTWVGVGCCLIGLNGVFMVVLLFFSCSLVPLFSSSLVLFFVFCFVRDHGFASCVQSRSTPSGGGIVGWERCGSLCDGRQRLDRVALLWVLFHRRTWQDCQRIVEPRRERTIFLC